MAKTIAGSRYGFAGPRFLAVDDFGRLDVADQDVHRMMLIDPDTGDILGVLGDGMQGIGPHTFDDPERNAVRGKEYFISDSDNNRIVKYEVVVN